MEKVFADKSDKLSSVARSIPHSYILSLMFQFHKNGSHLNAPLEQVMMSAQSLDWLTYFEVDSSAASVTFVYFGGILDIIESSLELDKMSNRLACLYGEDGISHLWHGSDSYGLVTDNYHIAFCRSC